MIWARKLTVHILAIVLLVSLLGGALSIGFNAAFGSSDNLKRWLADSKIYDHIVAKTLDDAQSTSSESSTVPLNNPLVVAAAKEAFPPALLQQSVNTIIDSNYAWLEGKTSTPSFTIDLTKAKEAFAAKVGTTVQSKLASLPVCTPAQLTQLQIPADPLTVTCRPSSLDPKTEGNRVAQEVAASAFLEKPVITASTLTPDSKDGASKPYYQEFADAPQKVSIAKKLPLIYAVVAILAIVGIIFIAPTRRKGVRRIGVMLTQSGIILLGLKFASDAIVQKVQAQTSTKNLTGEISKPYTDLLHSIETALVKYDLMFGAIFLTLGIVIFIYLFTTRTRKPKTPKAAQDEDTVTIEAPGTEFAPSQQGPVSTVPVNQSQPTVRRPRPASMDVFNPQPSSVKPKPIGQNDTPPNIKKDPRPRRPRLIQ